MIGETEGLSLEAAYYHPDGATGDLGLRAAQPLAVQLRPEVTGDLYIADVGQITWEEINFQPAGSPGGRTTAGTSMEAVHCYPADVAECPRAQVGTLPVAEYKHGEDGCSITGLGVYRGAGIPRPGRHLLQLRLVHGQVLGTHARGRWRLDLPGTARHGLAGDGGGHRRSGNLYATACVCEFSRQYDPFENPQGTVWRIVAADQVPEGRRRHRSMRRRWRLRQRKQGKQRRRHSRVDARAMQGREPRRDGLDSRGGHENVSASHRMTTHRVADD